MQLHRNCSSARLHVCTFCTCIALRVNTRTSSPLLSPQRLSVSSSMIPDRRARARRVYLDRRLKVPDGERRSGPAPVISCQRPAAAPTQDCQGPTSAVYPAGRPSLAVLCSASPSALLCALNQGPLTRYLLSFQMTSLALGPVSQPLRWYIRGNKIKNYASSSRCGDLGDQLPPASEAPHLYHTTPTPLTIIMTITITATTTTIRKGSKTQKSALHRPP